MRLKATLVCLALLFCSCLRDDNFKQPYTSYLPAQIGDDWKISTPQNQNLDPEKLDKVFQLLYSDDRFMMARSLLVFKNGYLVAEAYPGNPKDINAIYNIQSCTKSVTAMIAGIAVADGMITDMDEKLYNIFPGHFDQDIAKRSVTIKDALTMRTGLEFNNSVHTQHLYQHKGNSIEYVLSRKMLHPSGTVMNYNDGAPHLVSKVIESKTGMSMQDYAGLKLFAPLNITDWKWERSKDGTTYGAFSLYLKPRDLGKLGQLLLQNGSWQGHQIIDSQYLEEATSIQVSANFNNEPYGYYFWILPADSAYAAYGHGGQFLLVVPDKDLVVVYTAWPYTSGEFFDQKSEMISLILNSCN